MRIIRKGKIVLVGTDFIGISIEYLILNRKGIEELVWVNLDKNKVMMEDGVIT